MTIDEVTRRRLLQAATEAADRAYAPYSDFHVGAAVLTDAGVVYTGCNVENASSPLAICAERSAIAAAVNDEGPGMGLRAVAVANAEESPCSPCGACRQTMAEFGDPVVLFTGEDDDLVELPLSELLPHSFRLD
ncbi:MAG: cytidine deaminase [Chloroflexi bacterium]|nr:cytidine deaminase [Chloroflexota bacterium]